MLKRRALNSLYACARVSQRVCVCVCICLTASSLVAEQKDSYSGKNHRLDHGGLLTFSILPRSPALLLFSLSRSLSARQSQTAVRSSFVCFVLFFLPIVSQQTSLVSLWMVSIQWSINIYIYKSSLFIPDFLCILCFVSLCKRNKWI